MSVARRTCGYIGTQFWNQGRTQEIKDSCITSVISNGSWVFRTTFTEPYITLPLNTVNTPDSFEFQILILVRIFSIMVFYYETPGIVFEKRLSARCAFDYQAQEEKRNQL